MGRMRGAHVASGASDLLYMSIFHILTYTKSMCKSPRYPSGARYEGEWRGNVKDGRGVYYYPKVTIWVTRVTGLTGGGRVTKGVIGFGLTAAPTDATAPTNRDQPDSRAAPTRASGRAAR